MSLQKYKNSNCFNGLFQMKKNELNKELKKYDSSIPVSKLTKPEMICSLIKLSKIIPEPPQKPQPIPQLPSKPRPPQEPEPKPQPPLKPIPSKDPEIPQYMKDDVDYSNALQEQYYLEKIKKNKDNKRYEQLKSEIQTLRKDWYNKYNDLQIHPSFQYKASLNEYYYDPDINPDEKQELYKNLYEEAVKYYPLIFVNYDPTRDFLDVKYTIKPETPELLENEEEATEEDKNIAQQIKNNLKFIEDLERKGRLNEFPSYKGWHFLQYILTIIFSEKYNTLCPLLPILTYQKYSSSDELSGTPEIYAAQAGECIKKGEDVLIIPMSMTKHENMIIIKVNTREVLRFEPHGDSQTHESRLTDIYLKEYTRYLNIFLNLKETPFKYIPTQETCPRISNKYKKGFQTLESLYKNKGSSESGGYCQLWSFFFAECIITNPDMPFNTVYKYALQTLRDDPERARMIIRGYFHEINEKLREFGGVIFNYIKNIPQLNRKYDEFIDKGKQNILIIDYINKKKEILAGKPNVFKGRGKKIIKKSKKFIIPKSIYHK